MTSDFDESDPAAQCAALLRCAHPDPHALLGAFPHPRGALVRVLKPGAEAVSVRTAHAVHPLAPVRDGAGGHALFEGVVPVPHTDDYRLVVTYPPGRTIVVPDGYRMPPTVDDEDLRRIADGTHRRLWEVLGARPTMMGTPTGAVAGTAFAVWAPRAEGVAVIGDFDGWTGLGAPMRRLPGGVWEVFVPGVGPGDLYKFRLRHADGTTSDRADPMARWAEEPPKTASRVAADTHAWRDADWCARRRTLDPCARPMSVYEVHLPSWRPGLDWAGLAAELVPYVAGLGFTHVELLPVMEHPYGASWGYQVTSYYAPTARLGGPDGLRALVDAFHAAGIGVIADWVPAHFPRDGWALAAFDGAPLYEPADPLRADHPDWGTLTFDYARPEVRAFLVSSALYWIERFHFDGLRVDAVASMVHLDYSRGPGRWRPNAHGGREDLAAVRLLRELTDAVRARHPGVALIAEDSSLRPGTTAPTARGGLGFHLRWNLGWLHDTLGLLAAGADARTQARHLLTRPLGYSSGADGVLAISHDEVVHGKGTLWSRMPGDDYRKAAGLRTLLAYQWAHPGKQLLFMGQEFGQRSEWCNERGVDWFQLDPELEADGYSAGILRLVGDINAHYRALPALWSQDADPRGYSWIDANDSTNNVLSFLRYGTDGSVLAAVFNFSGVAHADYHLGLPSAGRWREILNTDAAEYNGGGVGNFGGVEAVDEPRHGRPASAVLVLPPLSALWLEPAE